MKKGVTLVELLVSVILLALIIAGLTSIFIAARRYIAFNRSRVQAMEFNKHMLERLHWFVREDNWNEAINPLYFGENKPGSSMILGTINYTAAYNVTAVVDPNNPELRRVEMVVNWTEPTP